MVSLPVLAVTSALTGSASSATASDVCTFDARFTDPAGDVNDLVVVPVDPVLDPDGLDLREAWLSTNAANDALTFHAKVTDLSALTGGLRATGEIFEWSFALGGTKYRLHLVRPLLQATLPANAPGTFALQNASGATLKSGLTGTFDAAQDLVTVTLKNSDLTTAAPVQTAFKVGDLVTDLKILSRREVVTEQIPLPVGDSDVATGPCSYRIGDRTPSPSPTLVTMTATATATTTVTSQPTATATTTVTSQPTATATTTATATATATQTVTAGPGNRAPEISKIAAKPLEGQGKARAKSPIRFRVKASDADGDPLSYKWTFGDGNKARGKKVINHYDFRGQYRVVLLVSDGVEQVKTRFVIKIGKPKKR